MNFGEKAIDDVMITLSGTDDRGNGVSLETTTDSDGLYAFMGLRPGEYAMTESQPAGFDDGIDVVGSVGGVPVHRLFRTAISG